MTGNESSSCAPGAGTSRPQLFRVTTECGDETSDETSPPLGNFKTLVDQPKMSIGFHLDSAGAWVVLEPFLSNRPYLCADATMPISALILSAAAGSTHRTKARKFNNVGLSGLATNMFFKLLITFL